jgi:hypothetical protein
MRIKKYNNHDEDTPPVTCVTCTTSQIWQSNEDWDLNTNKHDDHDDQVKRRFLQLQDHGDGGNYQWDHLKAPRSMMNMMIR